MQLLFYLCLQVTVALVCYVVYGAEDDACVMLVGRVALLAYDENRSDEQHEECSEAVGVLG